MSADPLIGKVLADRFAILERIGEGGTGVVYKAKQLSVDRVIAIKVLGAHVSTDPSWVKRFQTEARAASRLDHPNTVRLIDFGQTKEGLLFIAMEFLHGKSLRDIIDQEKRISVVRTLKIISQVCGSLGEAHNQGIIHRDIKPDNIHIETKAGSDFVKVLDFSVAKVDAPDAMQTRAGVVFGTPAYMSPEQGRGVPLDRRSDIYAVGIVAYEMLSGKPPFDGRIPTEVVMMHLRDKPAQLQGFPPEVTNMVMRALEKDPGRRQQTTDELDQECQQLLMELSPRQTPAGVPIMNRPSGSSPLIQQAPPMSAPPPGAAADQRTMMAQAPILPSAPPASSGGTAGSDQRTMMAQAPIIPSTSTPPSQTPNSELRTMMAEAPVIPPNARPMQQNNEIKTMIAQAPIIPQAAPPGGAPQPVVASAASQQRTMMAQPAPTPSAPNPQATMMLGDSAGVVAFAQDRAQQARASMAAEPVPAQGTSILFWLAWVVIGIGGGLGAHFYFIHRAVQ